MKRKSISFFIVKDMFKVGHLVEDTHHLSFSASQKAQSGHADQLATRDAYRFRTAISKMKANAFIKHYELHNSNAKIVYYGDYTAFKRQNPHTSIQKEEYLHYLGSQDMVCELLFDFSIYLLKELPFLNEIVIEIPNHGKLYRLEITRDQLDTHLQCRLTDRKDGHHHRYFYIYRDEELDKFTAEFIKVKRMRRKKL